MSSETPDNQPTRTRLLAAVRDGGNAEAWTDFHRLYAPLIEAFLRRMGLAGADVDDAKQEILMIAHAALRDGTYDRSRGRFRGWLCGVARNKALEAHRNRRRPSRAQSPGGPDGVDCLSGLPDKSQEAERLIWEQEWRLAVAGEAMRQVRATLNRKVWAAFVSYAVERRPVEEVAAELGIATSSVYVYKQRALQAIRRWIAEQVPEREAEPI
ncbi:MAG: RNA polymerase sigma factor [Phycisphaerae bacterium]